MVFPCGVTKKAPATYNSPKLSAPQTAATMRYTVSYLAIRLLFTCYALICTAGCSSDDEFNATTMKFATDDGEIFDAILTPSDEASSRSKSDENAKKVTFTVCKPRQSCEPITKDHPCDRLKSMVVPQVPFVIIIHGFGGSANSDVDVKIKDAYLKHGDKVNIVAVDWAPLAKKPYYGDATYGAITVGEVLPPLIHHFVVECGLIAIKDVHLVGHSMGAHAAGHAGKRYRDMYGSREVIGRITGLDPAGPKYTGYGADHKLDPTDAAYVDVIHTNDCSPWKGCFGIRDKIGHADFYPNGGSYQPGCKSLDIGCSHRRAIDYYAESVIYEGAFRSCCYKAKHGDSDANKCKDGTYDKMGHYTTAKGDVYCYCKTNAKSRFSLTGDSRTGNWAGNKMPYLTAHLAFLPVLLKFPLSML